MTSHLAPAGGPQARSDARSGLSAAEAQRRLELHGPNELPRPPAPGALRRVLRSLKDPLVVVLLVAFALTLITRDFAESAVIGLVIVVNTTLGLHQELQAEHSVRALADLVQQRAWVVRDGRPVELPSVELVPGDLVLLRQGDLVPADAILVEGPGVQVDESMLTGESVPVTKEPESDVSGLLYSGTIVVHGHGQARVTATGTRSAVGDIASLMSTAMSATPLQRRMGRLSGHLAIAAVVLSCVVMLLGLWRGEPLETMVLTTVALIVAAVPESLPLVVTVSLALGARRMATRQAIVRNLAAVETLGSVTVLATDKTGTLTQGTMSVAEMWQPDSAMPAELARALVLCNDSAGGDESGRTHGDPTDSALLRAAVAEGTDADALRAAFPRLSEVPFDSTRKTMTTVHLDPTGGELVLHKGAPEYVLAEGFLAEDPSTMARARTLANEWGNRGIRVLAVAQATVPQASPESLDGSHAARLLGLVGLHDPVRESSRGTITACREAGLQVILVTGDHAATARAIADQVGIGAPDTPARVRQDIGTPLDPTAYGGSGVIARATPADKQELVTRLKKAGQVVAMTGDGVNDAPALRAADIGVAMGVRGTEVARQAADLVLADDNLGTLVSAIEEGRRVYDNIRRFLAYGLSGGAAEVVLMVLGPLVGIPLPLLPAQILWLNLVTHSFAGAGLGVQPADAHVLSRGPRPPGQGPLGAGLSWRTALIAVYLGAASLGAILLSPESVGYSAALLTLGAGQLAVAWGVRTPGAPVRQPSGRVDPLVPALLLAGLMLVASVTLTPLRDLLGTQPLIPGVWGLAAASAAGALLLTRLLRAGSV